MADRFPKNKILSAGFYFALILGLTGLLTACQPKEITTAKIYIQADNWDDALGQLERAVEAHPKNAEAHFLLGRAYGHYGRFEDMNQEFRTSLALSDKFIREITAEREKQWIQQYNVATQAIKEDRYESAAEALDRAILIDSTRYEAHKKLAFTYLKLDEPEKALQLYQELADRDPSDVDLLMSIGNLYYSQEQFDKVVPVLEKVLSIEPNYRDALANLALCYDALGETNKAEVAFGKAIDANPEDKDLVFLFAVHRYNRKQYTEAIQLFEQVLTMSPDDFESISNIGNAYLSLAESTRMKLKESRSGALPAEQTIELKNQAIKNYKRAIPYLEQALDAQPDHPQLWRNLGVAYINTGEKEKGEQAFMRAEDLQIQSAK